MIEEIEDVDAERKITGAVAAPGSSEHLLKIEHYREATHEVLRHWVSEIKDFREEMAMTSSITPDCKGIHNDVEGRLAKGKKLRTPQAGLNMTSPTARPTLKQARRQRDRTLPEQCPYRLEDVTAFDLQRDRDPDEDVWPPSVARVLNTRLGDDYPVRPDRGTTW